MIVYFLLDLEHKMFNEDVVGLNWKNVETLKIDMDNLILGSFWNNANSIDE